MSSPAGATWIIDPGCGDYPACLAELERAKPSRVHGSGRRSAVAGLDHEAAVTIVGARQASGYGLRVAERLAHELALAGVTIVSGMARGIDAAAHRGALAGGGATIAVLAGGPDVIYPRSSRQLYDSILDAGAAISEHPPGSQPHKHHFSARNRIMAALGHVVVIVEAAQPSGSLITADIAAKLGRTVGAIPGQLGIRVAEGTNDLLKEGAHLIRDARDILDLLFGVGGELRRDGLHQAPAPRPGPALEPRLRETLELVAAGAATVDRIAVEARLSPRHAALALVRLELLGYVAADPLGAYSPTGLRSPPE